MAVLKKGLVVFQFTISVVLIIGTITIFRQIYFMQNHDLGFKMEGLMAIDGPRIHNMTSLESYLKDLESFKNEIKAISTVKNISASSCIPGMEIKNSSVYGIPVEGRNTEKKIEIYYIDNNFFDTYGITMKAGRNFDQVIDMEGDKILLNEAALPYYGFGSPDTTIGR